LSTLSSRPSRPLEVLVNQLCDLAQIRCFEIGSVVRLHMRLGL